MVIFLDLLSAASVPRSYSGERLRIAPVLAFASTEAAIGAGPDYLYAILQENF